MICRGPAESQAGGVSELSVLSFPPEPEMALRPTWSVCQYPFLFSLHCSKISHLQRAQADERSPSLTCMPHGAALQEGTESGKTLVLGKRRYASPRSSHLSLLSVHVCAFAPRQGDPWDSQGDQDSCLLQI